MVMATQAIRTAQQRFAGAAAQVAREGAAAAPQARTNEAEKPRALPAQTPPNPGPPGGAQPADLAQAMMDQSLAAHELAANVKTVQAFDAMLEELARLPKPTEPKAP